MRRLVFTDLDGTIYKREAPFFIPVRKALRSTLEKYAKKRGLRSDCLYDRLQSTYPNVVNACQALGVPFSEFKNAYLQADLEKVSRDAALISAFDAVKSPVFVVTFAPQEYSLEILDRLGIGNRIAGIFAYEFFMGEKSFAKIKAYDLVRASQNALPSHCSAIGDNWVSDLKEAAQSGYQTVLISDAHSPNSEQISSTRIACDILEALAVIIQDRI